MAYQVKEIFYTLQGEGAQAGRPSVFCRFAGCNLWSGREADRLHAPCNFCDTDFVGTQGTSGGRYETAMALADQIRAHWPEPSAHQRPYCVLTGGEPLLQVDAALIEALHAQGFEIAIETNGTVPAPEGLDWICVSPKSGSVAPGSAYPWLQTSGDELKLVWPQDHFDLNALAALPFQHRFLQPMDVSDPALRAQNTTACIEACLKHPDWKLSLQTHKIIGIR